MAKVITLSDPALAPHINAAWLLTLTTMWQYDRLPIQEIQYSKSIIHRQLTKGSSLKHSFVVYCERVLLANKVLRADPSAWVDVPTIWFHPEYEAGFNDTYNLYQHVAAKRQTLKNYQHGISVIANGYWRYTQYPSSKNIRQCYNKLLSLREYGLIRIWNDILIAYQINTAI